MHTNKEVEEIRTHAYSAVAADERDRIVAWLRTFPLNPTARFWAAAIEARPL